MVGKVMKVRVIQINSLNHTVEIYSKLGLPKDKIKALITIQTALT